ncbi:unnamed protein product [Lactuca saligna]|uniref:Aquaporin n=1 Tax=Lactuca saligna TaxID=75948 RepID=A0AA35ZZB9_LACSI|nr:unnamed protein product [Lactuca saligna]
MYNHGLQMGKATLKKSFTVYIAHLPLSSRVGELAGIAVGATVMLNILIDGPLTGASMNSARTLGPAIAANNYKGIWIYLTAPILGALAGAVFTQQ